MSTQTVIAFKYCNKGCGADYYYGFAVEQTVGTIDAHLDPDSYDLVTFDSAEELLKKTRSYNLAIVIYLFRNVYADEVFREVVAFGKERKNNYVTIAAGTYPSGDPRGVLRYFEYVVVGDCELAVSELVKQVIEGSKVKSIPGVWSSKHGKIVEGGRATPVEIDAIPPFAERFKMFSPIEITRGCPWGCKFCCVPYIYGGTLRHRSIDNIVEAVKIMKKRGKKVVNFLTPNAFAYGSVDRQMADPKKVEELLRALSKIGGMKIIFGNYLSNVRPDFVTDELVIMVKKYTQTPSIHMGGQSGSNSLLESAHVGYTMETILQAVQIVKKHGLGCSVDIMLGLPGETEADRLKTHELITKLVEMGAIPRIHAFMPLPGTPFAGETAKRVGKEERDLVGKLSRGGRIMQPFVYEEKVGWSWK
jgi:B12-binding domain/radical SAM domain protein